MYILGILKKEKNREPNMAKTKFGKLLAGIYRQLNQPYKCCPESLKPPRQWP